MEMEYLQFELKKNLGFFFFQIFVRLKFQLWAAMSLKFYDW